MSTMSALLICLLICTTTAQHLKSAVDIPPLPAGPHVSMPALTSTEAAGYIERAFAAVSERLDKQETTMFDRGAVLRPGGAAWFMAASHHPRPNSRNLTRIALVAEEASKYVSHAYSLSRDQVSYGLPVMDVRSTLLGERCPLEVDFPCQPRKYRAHSGYCNNVQSPHWGNANTRLLRFMPAEYGDGVSVPRHSSKGQPLPSAREISLAVHRDVDLPHPHLMALAAVWGELVAHDITHTPRMAGAKGERLKCCGVNFNDFHSECFPIRLPENDPVHARTGDKCQEYARSATAPRIGCTLGPREQLNQATSFLDASVVYGNSHEEALKLRTLQGGLLRSQPGNSGKILLPPGDNVQDCRSNGTNKCFQAGDPRVNEHVGLAALHTVLLREHNRLAKQLATLNPHWGDDTLYHEARRIVAAEIQHITYNEFLPVALGQDVIDRYGLRPQSSGHFSGYNINLNSGVANSVATAALQFVASLMPKSLQFYDRNGRRLSEQPIAPTFYSPQELHTPGGVDRVLFGLLRGRAQKEDEFINEVMTNHMFEDSGKGHSGLDLAAQMIQQGRDHGVPSYTRWRDICNLPKATQFTDLSEVMSNDVINALRKAYRDVADVDLFTGGLAETPLEGAVVGPTFACMLGRQFHYLRRGDRYWYENDLPPSSFTREQLIEIRRSSLARLICDNTDNINTLQPLVFIEKDPYLNTEVSCDSEVLQGISLEVWREVSPSFVLAPGVLSDALNRAKREANKVLEQEVALWQAHRFADPQSPIGTAYGFNRPTRQATEIANTSLVLQFATARFVSSFLQGQLADPETSYGGVAPRDLQELLAVLPSVDVSEVLDIPRVFRCDEQTLPCDHTSRFRTATGWCNNLKRPELGKSLRAFTRFLPSAYQDGLSIPRSVSVTGKPLPSARLVSTRMHSDVSFPHTRYSLMFMQFAQLLDHDLTHTPVHKGFEDTLLECKECDAQFTVHPECYPIPVPENDPYFPHINTTTGKPVCIPVVRSLPGQLTLGARQQINQVTSYVDASFIYGSDVCKLRTLRSVTGGGRLNVTRHRHGKNLMPQITTHPECRSGSGMCFSAGDARSSEQPGLAAIHTLFMREHNRLAEGLAKLNPHWDDETLYQQARRILSAVTQHIVYREFLPRLLGWDAVHTYGLTLQSDGYFTGYDPTCDATIANEFASAAFRFGHSLLKPSLGRMDAKFGHSGPEVRLRDTFFNPDVLYEAGMVDELIRGLAATAMETLDTHITEEVTNHLFEDKKVPFSGMDLAAINIQRAREHGVTSYNEYRAHCNLTRAKTFEDLRAEHSDQLIKTLANTYAHVDDIDLFPGGLGEKPLPGGVLGSTFACIVARQFSNLKKCDRFWYENADPLLRFTEAQLSEIRKTTLSRLVCDNCEKVSTIQRSLLDLVDPFLNPRVPCASIPTLDLTLWKERRFCTAGENEIETGKAERISPCVMCTCTTEGPVCQSLKIGNCFHLARSFSAEAVLGDHVCKVQCAFVFRALPKVSRDSRHLLGFS